jgi:hypothetical protein
MSCELREEPGMKTTALVMAVGMLLAAGDAHACISGYGGADFAFRGLPADPPAGALVLRVKIQKYILPRNSWQRIDGNGDCYGCDAVAKVLEVVRGKWPGRSVRLSRDQGLIVTDCNRPPPKVGEEVLVVGIVRREPGKGEVVAPYAVHFSPGPVVWTAPNPVEAGPEQAR